jgi:uncharacterized protein YkwD
VNRRWRAVGVVCVFAVTATSCDSNVSPPRGQRYEFGDPSTEEQQLWFLTNRARADPAGEARRLLNTGDRLVEDGLTAFGVDRNQLLADFDGYVAQPPVIWDAQLAQAAARHGKDLAETRSQGHRDADGSRPNGRVRDTGSKAANVFETVASFAHSTIFAHAAFLIDWGGPPPTGVQEWPKPGHRMAILSALPDQVVSNAVGMSWLAVDPGDDKFGPNVVVQEFARVPGLFIVGTVWADANGNDVFDLGEGVGGVEVRLDRGDWYTVTATAGGYEIPVEGAQSFTIAFRAAGRSVVNQQVVLDRDNVLVNLQLLD